MVSGGGIKRGDPETCQFRRKGGPRARIEDMPVSEVVYMDQYLFEKAIDAPGSPAKQPYREAVSIAVVWRNHCPRRLR